MCGVLTLFNFFPLSLSTTQYHQIPSFCQGVTRLIFQPPPPPPLFPLKRSDSEAGGGTGGAAARRPGQGRRLCRV